MLNIHADEFHPASFQTLADLEELDEVDAANELLADLELLEMQEGIQRALDLVLDEPPTMTLQSFTAQDSWQSRARSSPSCCSSSPATRRRRRRC